MSKNVPEYDELRRATILAGCGACMITGDPAERQKEFLKILDMAGYESRGMFIEGPCLVIRKKPEKAKKK